MQIITVPHPGLRTKAKAVTKVDEKLKRFVTNLGQTLFGKKNPSGVGLAAPQVNQQLAVFATLLPSGLTQTPQIRLFINPSVIDHSDTLITGETKADKKPREEGCLSIPAYYGVVPRWDWVEYEYQIIEHNQLVNKKELFKNFAARVMQHEHDHLFGILFTDRAIEYNTPVFREISTDRWVEVDNQELLKF